jgi:hypothetical protein
MTALVAGNDLKSSPDRESNSRDKRIPKPNVVYVLVARSDDELAARFVAGQESIENSKVDTRCGSDLARSGNTPAVRRGLDKSADKPAPEPPGIDLLHRRIWLVFEHGGNRR